MKINFSLLDEPMEVNQGTVLVIEDVSVFAQLVKEFYQYDEQSNLTIFDSKIRSIRSSELLLITDILGYDINTSQVLKLLHTDIVNQLNDKPEVRSEIDSLVSLITDIIMAECLENELDIEYDEITLLELVKVLGIRIETKSCTVFEKIFEILQIFKYLVKKKILVFVNSLSYFSKDEIYQILEYIKLLQANVLFLEPKQIKEIQQFILDKDYILMPYNN
ncbi:type II-A CRISPR-associated protein Csn2 [Streptococcus raffinosi]|uniref:Type II-A CRISPR-associated protein Csn2 n=1 Tax=Streptococcus raffinosi TaxID=3053355 RepID=A0ABT7LQE8_9STRE|nr:MULTISPECIES: type II-A CRISPR-associated protein Csn2 [unclassified Streptococcus]MDL5042870.1 type II-A CRISPR-associated protein Csn2 [Streptococcus sp. VTCC 12812]MDM0093895.1 type II-A CRISPR-associated protein Csn2 [Streptococcus sp. VTCC 12813]